AGMPTISDPGFKLVEEVLKRGFEVDVIPGPTAIETALSISGLPTDRFTFLGFLPREKGKIEKLISQNIHNTVVVYESPYRVVKTLEIVSEIYPNAKVSTCNDLTKKFQKVYRGDIKDVLSQLKNDKKIVGEWVIVLAQD